MARKGKIGLDYFSHDTDMATDIRVKIIMAKHGLNAYGVFNMLLEKLYSEKGYYLQLSDNFNILLVDECKISIDVYILILNECIEQSLFSKEMYEKYNILTSERVQNNYIAGTERRKEVSFIREFLLVDTVNVYSNRVNVSILPLNTNIGTQRERESKKKVKEKEKVKNNYTASFDAFWKLYPARNGKKTGKAESFIAYKAALKKISHDDLIKAIELQSKSEEWLRNNGAYVPDAHRWLKKSRWEDEVSASAAHLSPVRETAHEAQHRKNMEVIAKMKRDRGME